MEGLRGNWEQGDPGVEANASSCRKSFGGGGKGGKPTTPQPWIKARITQWETYIKRGAWRWLQALEILCRKAPAVWLKSLVRALCTSIELPKYGKHSLMGIKYCFLVRGRDVKEVLTRQGYQSKSRMNRHLPCVSMFVLEESDSFWSVYNLEQPEGSMRGDQRKPSNK